MKLRALKLRFTRFRRARAVHFAPLIAHGFLEAPIDPAVAPASILQNLVCVSPMFLLILGVFAVLRLKIGGENIARAIRLFGETLPVDALIGAAAGIAVMGIAAVSLKIAAQ